MKLLELKLSIMKIKRHNCITYCSNRSIMLRNILMLWLVILSLRVIKR